MFQVTIRIPAGPLAGVAAQNFTYSAADSVLHLSGLDKVPNNQQVLLQYAFECAIFAMAEKPATGSAAPEVCSTPPSRLASAESSSDACRDNP